MLLGLGMRVLILIAKLLIWNRENAENEWQLWLNGTFMPTKKPTYVRYFVHFRFFWVMCRRFCSCILLCRFHSSCHRFVVAVLKIQLAGKT